MIDNDIVETAQRLLADGRFSQRQIGRILGISRTLVGLIHHAKRKPFTDPGDRQVEEPEGPIVRCPTCGGKTRLPCVCCRIREILQKKREDKQGGKIRPEEKRTGREGRREMAFPGFRIELSGEHRRRYEEIRDWRSAQTNPFFIDIPDDWPWRNLEKKDFVHEKKETPGLE